MLNIKKLDYYCYNEHKYLKLTKDELTKVLTDLKKIDGNIRIGLDRRLSDIDDFAQEAEDCFEDVLEFRKEQLNSNLTKLDKIYIDYDEEENLIIFQSVAGDEETFTIADIYD